MAASTFSQRSPGDVLFRWLRWKLHREENWSQRSRARNAAGDGIDPKSPNAKAWCLAGAIALAPPALQWELTKRIEAVTGRVEPWNDKGSRTLGEVLDAINQAHAAFKREVVR